jgi:hypothetical protein
VVAAVALLGVSLGFWASAWAKAPARERHLLGPAAQADSSAAVKAHVVTATTAEALTGTLVISVYASVGAAHPGVTANVHVTRLGPSGERLHMIAAGYRTVHVAPGTYEVLAGERGGPQRTGKVVTVNEDQELEVTLVFPPLTEERCLPRPQHLPATAIAGYLLGRGGPLPHRGSCRALVGVVLRGEVSIRRVSGRVVARAKTQRGYFSVGVPRGRYVVSAYLGYKEPCVSQTVAVKAREHAVVRLYCSIK